MTVHSKLLSPLLAVVFTACASSGATMPGSAAASASEEAPVVESSVAAQPSADETATEPVSTAGLYSDTQADRGRSVFRSRCTECHYSSEFRDRQFKFKWSRRNVGALYELVSTSMPEDQPGSLEPARYADLVAYILRMNGFEAGEVELQPDQGSLRDISLASIRGN